MKEIKISLNDEQIKALKEGKLKLALVDANQDVTGGLDAVAVDTWSYTTKFVTGE